MLQSDTTNMTLFEKVNNLLSIRNFFKILIISIIVSYLLRDTNIINKILQNILYYLASIIFIKYIFVLIKKLIYLIWIILYEAILFFLS